MGTVVFAVQGPEGSADCKNYCCHLYFTVVTFLTKIQNWCYITKKNLSKHNCEKNWMVKTTTIQVFDHMTKNLDGKNHSREKLKNILVSKLLKIAVK